MNLLKFVLNKCKVGAKILLILIVITVMYHIFETTRNRDGQAYYSNFDKFHINGSTPKTANFALPTTFAQKLDVRHRAKQLNESTVEGWDYNTSRDTSLYIQPENITTVLLPEKFCSSPLSLIVVICSSPVNFANRNAIRETWAFDSNNPNFPVQFFFLLGQVNNATIQEQIEQESVEKNDVIQERFVDSYNNLTLKTLMMLKLMNSHCLDNVKFVMKTDDDVYVNMPPLINYLRTNGTKNLLMGYLMRGVTPVRNRKSKWNAPYYLYKRSRYPHYLSGTGYIMSIDIVPKLYAASFRTSIFYLEDVYITGILSEVINLKPKHHAGFTYRKRDFRPCTYEEGITTHRVNETEIRALHTIIRRGDMRKCKKKSPPKSLFAEKAIKEKKCNTFFFRFC